MKEKVINFESYRSNQDLIEAIDDTVQSINILPQAFDSPGVSLQKQLIHASRQPSSMPRSKQFFINTTSQTDQIIQSLLLGLSPEAARSSVTPNVKFLSNEMIINAFYHGIKASIPGKNSLVKVDRRCDFCLTNKQTIKVELQEGPEILRIQVSDPFGMLELPRFLKILKRCYHEKKIDREGQGAGLGFYFLFENSQLVDIRVRKNKETSISCYLFKNLRQKLRKSLPTGLFFNLDVET